jgi:transcriptional regulator with XRE-family HTH domain
MGKTQEQLAQLLCVSPKTIQSYEQGWRKITPIVERQMLLFYAIKRPQDVNARPCWEIKNCPDEWRDNCIVWELKFRHFCWFISGTFCQGRLQGSWENKIEMCRKCEVYQSMCPSELTSISSIQDYSI